jgi:hypothetical protein
MSNGTGSFDVARSIPSPNAAAAAAARARQRAHRPRDTPDRVPQMQLIFMAAPSGTTAIAGLPIVLGAVRGSQSRWADRRGTFSPTRPVVGGERRLGHPPSNHARLHGLVVVQASDDIGEQT